MQTRKNIDGFDPYWMEPIIVGRGYRWRVCEWTKTGSEPNTLCVCENGSAEENRRNAEIITNTMNGSRRACQISAIAMFERRSVKSEVAGEIALASDLQREADRLRAHVFGGHPLGQPIVIRS
jgi:hypothetical protein